MLFRSLAKRFFLLPLAASRPVVKAAAEIVVLAAKVAVIVALVATVDLAVIAAHARIARKLRTTAIADQSDR